MYKSFTKHEFRNTAIDIGNRIYQRRKELGLSQDELFVRTGIPRQTISSIENGHRAANIRTLTAIAVALEIPLSELQPKELDQYLELSPEILDISRQLQKLPYTERHQMITALKKLLQ